MNHNLTTFFLNLRACKHIKECKYRHTEPDSFCMNGGGDYCGVHREWSTRRQEAMLH